MSFRLGRVVVAIALLATPMTPVAAQARDPRFTASPDSAAGLPGTEVAVTFTYQPPVINYRAAAPVAAVTSCEFFLDGDPKSTARCGGKAGDATWTMVMPRSLTAGKHEVSWAVRHTLERNAPDKGVFTFEALRPAFSTVVEPAAANPGEPVDVRFTSGTAGVSITGCDVHGVECDKDSRGWFARVPAPDTTSALPWKVAYTGGPGTDDTAPGRVEITVEPWPAPEFQVGIAGSDRVGPGTPVTVRFESLTPGVTVKTCSVTYRGERIDCTGTDLATVTVPGDAEAGPATLPWELTFASSRRGEQGDHRQGSVDFTVVVEDPRFSVTVQPASARPGDTVTLTFTSLVQGVEIADCIAFFPHAAGDTCGHPSRRHVVRTRVPDLPFGATLLRWGVESTGPGGRKGVDDDVIPYLILPPLPKTGPTTTPPTKKTTPSTEATTPPTIDSAGAVDTTDRTTSASAQVAPAFEVVAEPAAATGGREVTVSHRPADTGVAITGCWVGFTEKTLTTCQQSANGWTAQVEVPPAMPVGPSPLRWTIAYARSGSPGGTAQGLSSFRVLPPDKADHHWWDTAWGLLWRTALGAAVLAGLIAFRAVRKPVLDRFRPRPATGTSGDRRPRDEAPSEEAVFVVPVPAVEEMSVRVDRPDAPPAHDIRLEIRRPRLTPHVPEGLP
ncbi:hypothetical protein [Actinoplanes sp. L3-i22]|uniref:hypothetical protein n=1 Tax=Actinoplanes sp. L3-i22 TaxID=2836373 RepID=UPI001C77F9FE|nr:hypothetical protein [Actinoplanes sp. L3-i22]BCY13418.1 hypothetical protein L3i22_085060 [Actinoplanes sp. L3-i22]